LGVKLLRHPIGDLHVSNLGLVLKNEITRLARKEVRAQTEPLRKANSAYRRELAELKRQFATLNQQMKVMRKKGAAPLQPQAEPSSLRFSAKGLRSLRARLGLSAADFAKLVGASGQSVYNWEAGKAVPRKSQLTTLAGIRSLGKREAQARLAALAG
jgi:DNA-binding transcriptional regulator YiaG